MIRVRSSTNDAVLGNAERKSKDGWKKNAKQEGCANGAWAQAVLEARRHGSKLGKEA